MAGRPGGGGGESEEGGGEEREDAGDHLSPSRCRSAHVRGRRMYWTGSQRRAQCPRGDRRREGRGRGGASAGGLFAARGAGSGRSWRGAPAGLPHPASAKIEKSGRWFQRWWRLMFAEYSTPLCRGICAAQVLAYTRRWRMVGSVCVATHGRLPMVTGALLSLMVSDGKAYLSGVRDENCQ